MKRIENEINNIYLKNYNQASKGVLDGSYLDEEEPI